MNSITVMSVFLLLVASVYGRSYRVPRARGQNSGWGNQNQGWAPAPAQPISITEDGASQAVGIGSAIAEHDAVITVIGSPDVPALLNISTGSGVGLSQFASNYQQTQINSDGSSAAYQGNSASNSGYAYDYLGGGAQGLNVDVQSNGWSAVEGEGGVGQVDSLNHQAPGSQTGSGWKKP